MEQLSPGIPQQKTQAAASAAKQQESGRNGQAHGTQYQEQQICICSMILINFVCFCLFFST